MACPKSDSLVRKVCDLYEKISKLDSLSPSKDVDALFTELVAVCTPPHPIDVSTLCPDLQRIRAHLILLCGRAEGLMEKHYSKILGTFQNPLDHLHLFPYYSNYLKLARAEHALLAPHRPNPARVAFVGSGPLPLTSIVLAAHHLPHAVFHNYDVDPAANELAAGLVGPGGHPLMEFRTADIVSVPEDVLREYDVVFLAALVGMDGEEKRRVVAHLAAGMGPGAILVVRSARGARAFLYPVVEPGDLGGFEVLSVYHPTDDVINSVIVARKCSGLVHSVAGGRGPLLIPCNKCGEIFNPLVGRAKMVEEFPCQDHVC
ncbi:nicotianamine synthase [Striga asiatica]|uniref:Nicotianamine synthase n=1 Tax=Striga asiatica TaxID=4170 RepID=A0A5A7QUK6_STRAF|nr:nicotianamine synthase [Striga asiatica]